MIVQERIGSVTVWAATLADALHLDAFAAVSVDELERAKEYNSLADRDRFLSGRTLLRHALSQTVDHTTAEDEWTFEIDRYGKPSVAGHLPQLGFSISHTGNCATVAISCHAAIGVDVEARERNDKQEIIWECLTPCEARDLSRVAEHQQWDRFLSYWTAKEACAKALGLGVAIPFDAIGITLGASPTATVHSSCFTDAELILALTTLEVDATGYRLGVVTHEQKRRLQASEPYPVPSS